MVQHDLTVSVPGFLEIGGGTVPVLGALCLVVLGIGFRTKFGGLVKGASRAVKQQIGKLTKRK